MTRSFSRNQLPVRAASSLSFVRISNGRLKRRYSSSCHCSARLPGQTMRQRLQVAAGDQLLDQQPGHDRLARAGVVGQQKAQRLARQHRLVDRRDLVGQRLDERGVDRQHGVKQVRQVDAVRFGDQAEQRAVAVEAPGPPLLDNLQPRLVVAVEDLVRDATLGRPVDQRERAPAVPFDAHDRDSPVGQEAAHGGVGLQVFERHRHVRVQLRGTPSLREPSAGQRGWAGRGADLTHVAVSTAADWRSGATIGRAPRSGEFNSRGAAGGAPGGNIGLGRRMCSWGWARTGHTSPWT